MGRAEVEKVGVLGVQDTSKFWLPEGGAPPQEGRPSSAIGKKFIHFCLLRNKINMRTEAFLCTRLKQDY